MCIRWAASTLDVTNDGVDGAPVVEGAGITGLRERLAPLGGDLEAHATSDRFHLVAHLTLTDPAEAP